MTVRYVGPGGSNANSGLSWALRKLTLNGVEDTPVAAGDTVYVGPGVYREMLTVDVSGSAGSPITYIGDYSGVHTDGVGGVVRITGSNNDQTATRATCITATGKSYRTFRGFVCDGASAGGINLLISCTNIVIDQCYVTAPKAANSILVTGAAQSTIAITNCYLVSDAGAIGTIEFYHSADVSDAGHTVSNCIIVNGTLGYGIYFLNVGGATVKNCNIANMAYGVWVDSLAAGQTITVNNCLFANLTRPCIAITTQGDIVEDYNNSYSCGGMYQCTSGGHSTTYLHLLDSRWFFEMVGGGRILTPFDLASYSQLINVAGTSPTTTDMRGTSVQGTQREFGPLEYDSTLLIESAAGGGGGPWVYPWRGNIG